MFGGNLVPSCLDLFDIWQSQQFFVCSVLSGWSTVNCGVGRKLPAPQHPATSAPTPPSQPSIRDLSHNPILPCFISSSPIVVFPQSPLLYLFRWLLCSSATVFVFFSTSSLFSVDMSTVLVFPCSAMVFKWIHKFRCLLQRGAWNLNRRVLYLFQITQRKNKNEQFLQVLQKEN